MRRIMIPAVILITGFILLIGFFLPRYVLDFKDRQTIGKLDVTNGSISFEAKSELGIIDRLKMITTAASIPLDNGKNLNPDTAYQQAVTEIGKFNSASIMELDLSAGKLVKNGVSFYIDSTDPTKNMIVWNIIVEDKGYFISVNIDDETGLLLSVDYNVKIYHDQYIYEAYPSEGLISETAVLVESIAAYYGLTATPLEPEKNGKYLGLIYELSDGQNSMTMTIGLSEYGIWINI